MRQALFARQQVRHDFGHFKRGVGRFHSAVMFRAQAALFALLPFVLFAATDVPVLAVCAFVLGGLIYLTHPDGYFETSTRTVW